MAYSDWINDTQRRFRDETFTTAVTSSFQELWVGGLRRFGQNIWNYGESVWDYDWDVLIILDTCRWDVLAEVSDEYDFLEDYDPNTDTFDSAGSRSPEWIDKTFNNGPPDELKNTAYITSNPHSRDIENPEQLGMHDEVWKYGWDDNYGFVTPDTMTDRAIDVSRNHDFDRVIVHYMQPHQPYKTLADKKPEWFGVVGTDDFNAERTVEGEKMIWERLRDGEIERDVMWSAYKDNLRWVLDSLETVRRNMDEESVIISADHGEAFGEWGCYGHEMHVPIKELKRVPWFELPVEDTGEYTPSVEREDRSLTTEETEERLRDLGYM